MLQLEGMDGSGIGDGSVCGAAGFGFSRQLIHIEPIMTEEISIALQFQELLGEAGQPTADAGGDARKENKIRHWHDAQDHLVQQIAIDQPVAHQNQQLLAQESGKQLLSVFVTSGCTQSSNAVYCAQEPGFHLVQMDILGIFAVQNLFFQPAPLVIQWNHVRNISGAGLSFPTIEQGDTYGGGQKHQEDPDVQLGRDQQIDKKAAELIHGRPGGNQRRLQCRSRCPTGSSVPP